jgi:hypothetical protein
MGYPCLSTHPEVAGAVDVAIFSLHLSGGSSLAGSINFLTTNPWLGNPLVAAGVPRSGGPRPTVAHLKLLSSKHLAQVSPPSLLPELVPALASFLAL